MYKIANGTMVVGLRLVIGGKANKENETRTVGIRKASSPEIALTPEGIFVHCCRRLSSNFLCFGSNRTLSLLELLS